MPRVGLIAFVLAGLALAGGGAMWFRAALNESHARGLQAGRAEIEALYRADLDRRRQAGEAALEKTNREAAELEIQRDKLQEQLNDLAATIGRSASAGNACLDPELVRALAGIGQSGARPRARP